MSRIYAQAPVDVWRSTASFAANASATSSSVPSQGMARIVGIAISSASAKSSSGVRVLQSTDRGSNWDYYTDSNLSACSGSGFSYEVVGDAVKVEFRNGADAANVTHLLWWLRPV